MNDTSVITIEPETKASTALAIIPAASLPTLIAADTTDILGKLRAELAGYTPDASTPAGRAEIGSKAKKVGTAKRDFERLADVEKADHQAKIKKINAEYREIETNCDTIRDAILAPRVAHDQREKDRVAAHESALTAIEALFITLPSDATAEEISRRISQLQTNQPRDWQEFEARARKEVAATLALLQTAKDRIERREAEAAAEVIRQAEEAERQRLAAIEAQRLREEKIARDAAEAARVAAEAKAAREAEEAAETARRAAQMADYHRRMLDHVKNCGLGFIDKQPQPIGILQHELTKKIKFDAENFGDLLPEALAARDEALARLQRSIDEAVRREVEEEAHQSAEKRAREAAEALAAAKRERDRMNRARILRHEEAIAQIEAASSFGGQKQTADQIQGRINAVRIGWGGERADWEEFAEQATQARATTLDILETARQEAADRETVEAIERARFAAERAEIIRLAEVARAEQEKADAVEAERRRMEQVRAKEDALRIRQAEEDRVAAEKRAANRAHQAKINGEALAAILQTMSEVDPRTGDEARKIGVEIIKAIAMGKVPHTTINY